MIMSVTFILLASVLLPVGILFGARALSCSIDKAAKNQCCKDCKEACRHTCG